MTITVTWSQAGSRPAPIRLLEETTVDQFLIKAVEVGADGFEVLLNGEPAEMDDLVGDGDVLILNPRKSFNG